MAGRLPPVVVIGASAGGVEALTRLVSKLPADLHAAVFVVLHIPSHTASQLDTILDRVTTLPVRTAQDGDPIEPGRIYVAEADRHLMIDGDGVRVTFGPREGRLRPSIDVLFRSAAATAGPRVIGVVLSGTLDDGTSGLWSIKDRGGQALVQDPATALFPGMPASAIQHVDVDAVLSLDALADAISDRARAMPDGPVLVDVPERLQVETLIAREGNGLQAGVMQLGQVSASTCPDCQGVLVQIEEGPITRFRCHTGHAYSMQSLLAAVDRTIQDKLWSAVRVIEERILQLQQMLKPAPKESRSIHDAEARDTGRRPTPLRALALNPLLSTFWATRTMQLPARAREAGRASLHLVRCGAGAQRSAFVQHVTQGLRRLYKYSRPASRAGWARMRALFPMRTFGLVVLRGQVSFECPAASGYTRSTPAQTRTLRHHCLLPVQTLGTGTR